MKEDELVGGSGIEVQVDESRFGRRNAIKGHATNRKMKFYMVLFNSYEEYRINSIFHVCQLVLYSLQI